MSQPNNAVSFLFNRVAVGAGTQTSLGADIGDFVGTLTIAVGHKEVSTSGATTIVYSILDSADNTTFAASTGLPAAQTTTHSYVGAAGFAGALTFELDTKTAKRYVAVKALTASTTATFDISATGMGIKQIS